MNEEDFYSFVNQPNTIILDIRWPDVYKKGHLPGAILLDNSIYTTEPARNSRASVILGETLKNTSIGLLCNCPDGHQARLVEEYLNGEGYTNTGHMKYSFETWSNHLQLVSGSSPQGDGYVTAPIDWGTGGGFLESPLVIFSIVAIPLFTVGIYFFYKTNTQTVTNSKIKQDLKRSDQKRDSEIAKMKEILKQKEVKSTKKPKRRR
ncbi:MAG: rhodanese-like domain-containing protein [Candidatus Hodarchaeales archaeon]|jgi:rhodanese-related sulfurtransferase